MNIRIATYNIHCCIGRDREKNIDRISAVLKEIRADIVALQEVTSSIKESANMLTELAAATDMMPIEGYTLNTAGTQYGNALLTRLPMTTVNRVDISVPGKEPRGVIEAVLSTPGSDSGTISIWATHLGLGVSERRFQIKKLLQLINTQNNHVTILLGDFNEWLKWGYTLRSLQQVFTKSNSPATFPAWRPLLKLDRIWVKPINAVTALERHVTPLSSAASDHLPLVADIAV